MFLRDIQFRWERISQSQKRQYPFQLPAYRSLDTLELHQPVTFFVGENGTGKSTLLEAIASLCDFPKSGGEILAEEHSEAHELLLDQVLRLSWMPRVRSGFFLRSETFFNFASLLDRRKQEKDFGGNPYSRYGGKSLHQRSHGEAFLDLFQNRFQESGNSIYLLDEPEAALSPMRQLAFLSIMKKLVDTKRTQFIICTHSPILLGYPGADIYSFDEAPLQKIDYEETPHYAVTKYFLNQRDAMLEKLFEEA
ncbi:AAA family ATPase [Tumebacillus algifaecis]|uniref:AAA family ATPase n=1 Tax=Tumebacillus algifaecis TaxID=1214604 RepID=UPI001D131041|nr:AAA family ATPase [Tumebacillus algifaecis]